MEKKGNVECRESATTLILYLYGEAPDPEGFEKHLETCPECSRWLQEHSRTLEFYRDSVPKDVGFDIGKIRAIPPKFEVSRRRLQKLGPVAALAVAAALILMLVLPLGRMSPPPASTVVENLETWLDEIDGTLDELSDFRQVSVSEGLERNGVMDELDNVMAELDDIQTDLAQF